MGAYKSAPRVCGDDPMHAAVRSVVSDVLPAYAGMIPSFHGIA